MLSCCRLRGAHVVMSWFLLSVRFASCRLRGAHPVMLLPKRRSSCHVAVVVPSFACCRLRGAHRVMNALLLFWSVARRWLLFAVGFDNFLIPDSRL